MANPHINYATFKSRFGDLGITEWTKYNYLSNYNFGLPAQTEVPDEYLELEYIQGTGTQYIDTDIKLSTDHIIQMIYQIDDSISFAPFGSYGNPGNIGFTCYNRDNNSRFGYFQIGAGTAASGNYNGYLYNQKATLSYSKNGLYQNGNKIYDIETAFAQQTINCYLFCRNVNNVATGIGAMMVYQFTIFKDGVPVLNLVPVRRLSDGAIGMYDTVTNSFFGNAGTGTFTAGPMKQRYVRVEYVGFDGDSFLNTGIVPTATMEFDTEYKLDEVPATETYRWIIGSYTNEDSNTTRILLYGGNTTYASILSKAAGGSIQAGIQRNTTTWYKDRIYRQGNLQVYESNGRQYIKERVAGATSSATLRIGLIGDTSGTSAKFKLKTLRILDNGQLIHNFVPVYDLALEEYGLYDMVEGKFYNANRGDLTGPWDFVMADTLTYTSSTEDRWEAELWNEAEDTRSQHVYVEGYTTLDEKQAYVMIRDIPNTVYNAVHRIVFKPDATYTQGEFIAKLGGKYIQFHQN